MPCRCPFWIEFRVVLSIFHGMLVADSHFRPFEMQVSLLSDRVPVDIVRVVAVIIGMRLFFDFSTEFVVVLPVSRTILVANGIELAAALVVVDANVIIDLLQLVLELETLLFEMLESHLLKIAVC